MIKCKLKCDKNYGGEGNWVDVDYIDTNIIKDIIDRGTTHTRCFSCELVSLLCVSKELLLY